MRRDLLRAEAQEMLARRRADQAFDREYARGVLARVRVDAAKLTSSEHWNTYLEQVAALNAADQQALAALLEPTDTYRTAEQCQKAEFERAVLRARIQARNECIELPRHITGA